MPLNVDIPKINITTEDPIYVDDDDENQLLSLSDALTDIEDLYGDERGPPSPLLKKKSKLKIKLPEDGAVTDLEDFEGSSDDEEVIDRHETPLELTELDLEAPITEESFKKSTKGKRKGGKMQFSTNQNSFYHSEGESSDGGVATGSEHYETESDVDLYSAREADIDLNNFQTKNQTDDNVASYIISQSSATSDYSDNESNNSMSSYNPVPQFLNVQANDAGGSTDVEVLGSDSDRDEIKKPKTRRRRHRAQRKPSVTDLEDICFTDDEGIEKQFIIKEKHKPKKHLVKSNTVPLDSENEENEPLPFPLSQPIARKNSSCLRIPDLDANFHTDIEDIDNESDLDCPEIVVDEAALDQKLQEISSGYGQVKEESFDVKNQAGAYCEVAEDSAVESDIDKKVTDEDEFQDDKDEFDVKSPMSDSFNIKFSPSIDMLNAKPSRNLLKLPLYPEEPLTDCENIDSSPDETSCRKMPLAVAQRHVSTDEEEFSDDDDSTNNGPYDIQLPPPTRNLVLIQENDSLIPTVRIVPLDSLELDLEEQAEEALTDLESFSEAEDALELLNVDQPLRPVTPDIPNFDEGVINVQEHVNRLKGHSPIPVDSLTDTEEVILDSKQKRKRAPKFKYMHERSLAHKNKIAGTDTEELIFSDCRGASPQISLKVPQKLNGGLTDTENLDLSDDDVDFASIRPLSVTPQHLRELGGESMILKEGSGPFSIIDKLELNKFSLNGPNPVYTPATTDSEDVMASAEEDNDHCYSRGVTATPKQVYEDLNDSCEYNNETTKKFDEEVMYLKGGGYSVDLFDKQGHVAFDFDKFSVKFGFEECESAQKPTLDITDQATLEQAAAQQGHEHQSSSQQTSSPAKAETDESQDKPDKDKSKKVTDQHQLSDEMKDLLKEMEKESKQ